MTTFTEPITRHDATQIAEAIEGSFAIPYAPWVWQIVLSDNDDMTISHCRVECPEPSAECQCYLDGNTTTVDATRISYTYERVASLPRRLCCPDPDNFCAEDADQILQNLLYGQTVFG